MDINTGSLAYSVDCAQPGDTLGFAAFILNDTIPGLMGDLIIDKDLTIVVDPNHNVFLSGQFNDQAIHILPDASVTIVGLNLIASEVEPGRAILNEGNLILVDVIICPPTGSAVGTYIENTGNLEILGDSELKGN